MINLIVNIFYLPFKRHSEKGLTLAIWLTSLAITFNAMSVLNILIGVLGLGLHYEPIHVGILVISLYYLISNRIELKLIKQQRFQEINLSVVLYLFGPIYLLISIIVFPLTFRYLNVFS
jgi:hypothetical protein